VVTVLAGIAALVFLKGSANGFSARAEPSAFEGLLAKAARRMAIPAGAREKQNPVAASKEVLDGAMEHWADHCAGCHANDGSGRGGMGEQMYPPAPDMRKAETQNRTDGELFYIIENGIRLTGMPAWGGTGPGGERASWALVRFIRHLPELTAAEKAEMEKLNPKGPEDRAQEQAEEDFLNGKSVPETASPHRH